MKKKILELFELLQETFLEQNFASKVFISRMEKIKNILSNGELSQISSLSQELREEYRDFFKKNLENDFIINAIFLYLIEDYLEKNKNQKKSEIKKFVYQM